MNSLASKTIAEIDGADHRVLSINSAPVELVRESYARYAQRDLPALLELFSSTVEITESAKLPWGGRFNGHAGVREFFTLLKWYIDAVIEPRTYLPAGSDVVVVSRLTGVARTTGKSIALDVVHLWSVHDGKIVRLEAFLDTPRMRAALGRG